MIVLQIDIHGVLTVEFKSDPPVSRNGNRKLSLPITNERMELEAWKVHVPRLSRCIQPDQHPFDARSMLSGHALVATPRKKELQTLVFKRAPRSLSIVASCRPFFSRL